MLTDSQHRRRRERFALVVGEVEAHAVGVLGRQRGPHALEVGQRAWDEPVAFGGLDVDVVEGGQVVEAAEDDLDTCFLCLVDVAAPLLVQAALDIFQRSSGERDLEDIARLADGEPVLAAGLGLLPARPPKPVSDVESPRFVRGGLGFPQPPGLRVGDRGLDRLRTPAAGDDGRPLFTENAPWALR